MNLYLDTSTLFKLYHIEEGTEDLMNFFKRNSIGAIYISEITEIEFSSAVWKKCRKREINEDLAKVIIDKFDNDAVNFQFVQQKDKVREIAKNLIAKYWKDGLRTLDSIQLTSALSVKYGIDRFFTSDKLLSDVAIHEGLEVKID